MTDTIGPYRTTKKLGAGAMGEVYAADGPDGRAVAVKVLKAGGTSHDEAHRRFRREAELCKSIHHPNVVEVLDFGIDDDEPYLAMPLMRGADLETCLERTGPLAPHVAVSIVLAACEGLASAHAHGAVHRDLKPANVFLDEREDGTVNVVVCDFGVAKIYDENGELTASGAVIGTPLYMAPEQLLDAKRVDARCDVWAMAMVLYHALTGRAAFADLNGIAELVLALGQNAVPPLQSLAPWVPAKLARVVHAGLLPLEDRIPTINELAALLREWSPLARTLKVEDLAPMNAEARANVEERAKLPKHASELRGGPVSQPSLRDSNRMPQSDRFLGRIFDGRYRIASPLGGGGMGYVYAATEVGSTRTARDLAIKVMTRAPDDLEARRRFLREAKATSKMSSAYVTSVVDFGVDEETNVPFLVMERLRGSDLARHIERCGAIEPEPVVALFVQAAEGLAAAHALGVVHRDVKPSNIFVHQNEDGTLITKVCDFGIAKLIGESDSAQSTELTRTGGLLGSPLYMSPEQARSSKHIDERSDVYSLGLSLHEALSGKRPWGDRTSMGELILAINTEDVPPLDSLAPWIDPELSAVIARAVSRDPAKRFPTMADFGAALRPFAARHSIKAADLVRVNDMRRALVPARPPGSRQIITADALSISTRGDTVAGVPREQRRGRFALLGAAALALLVAAGVGLRQRASSTTSGSQGIAISASTPAASVAAAIAPLPTLEPAPPSSASASASAPVIATAPPRIVKPRPSATASQAPVSVPPPTPPSTVGRGVTATDLPQ